MSAAMGWTPTIRTPRATTGTTCLCGRRTFRARSITQQRAAETGAWQQFAKPLRYERLDPGVDGLPVALVLHGDRDQRETEERERERKRNRVLEDGICETDEVCVHADRSKEKEHPSPKQHAEDDESE